MRWAPLKRYAGGFLFILIINIFFSPYLLLIPIRGETETEGITPKKGEPRFSNKGIRKESGSGLTPQKKKKWKIKEWTCITRHT